MPLRPGNQRLRSSSRAVVWLAAGLLLSGCAAMKPSVEDVAKEKAQRTAVQDVPPLRPRGKSNLPFWYSSKSREIEESLGGS